MIRKWMTTLLALMLAVMLPVCALADVQHVLTIQPGDDLASIAPVADLLDVLSFKVTEGDKSGALTITVDETDVLNIGLGADDTGLYVQSNLLSDDVLYVSWDDGFAVLTEAVLATAEMGGEALSSDEAEMVKSAMAEAKTSVVSAMQTGMPAMQTTAYVPTADEVDAYVQSMFPNDPAMVQYVKDIISRMVVEDGAFAAEGRDVATQKVTMTMTNEDFIAICDTQYMKEFVQQAVQQEKPELSGAALDNAVKETMNEIRGIYEQMDMVYVVEVYTADNGQTLVGMDLDMSMTVVDDDDSSKTVTVAMPVAYSRLSDPNGVSHKADATMVFDGQSMMDMKFDLYKGADGVSKGVLAMLVEGEEISFLYNAANIAADTRERKLELYVRSGATAIIEPSASDRPIIGFTVVTSPADPALLQDLDAATSTTAVNVMKLSEEEMQDLASGIETRAMQVVSATMAAMPTSVLQLVMQMMSE